MITLKILINLIDKYEQLLATAESFGYVNLKIFCSYSEEDKDKLNFLATFDFSKKQAATRDYDINTVLSELLETEACLWGEGASGLQSADYKEAEAAPLQDMTKVIDYFIDAVIPYSTGQEPIEQERVEAQQHWQAVAKQQATLPQAPKIIIPGIFKPSVEDNAGEVDDSQAIAQISSLIDAYPQLHRAFRQRPELFDVLKVHYSTQPMTPPRSPQPLHVK